MSTVTKLHPKLKKIADKIPTPPAPEVIEVKFAIRQNMYKERTKDVHKIVIATKCITIPGHHCARTYQKEISTRDAGIRFQDELCTGDYVVIFEKGNKKKASLVKITSGVYTKHIPLVSIYREPGFKNEYGDDVFRIQLTTKKPPPDTTREDMYAKVRDVEFVRDINGTEPIFQKYWKFQGHFLPLRQPERFVDIQ